MEEVSGRAAAAAHSEARGVVRRRDGVDGLRPSGATLRSGLRERAGRPHSRRSHRRKSSPLLRSALQVPAGPPRPSLSQPSVLLSLSLATLTRRSVSPLSGPTPQESVSPMHSVDHVRKSEEPPNPATSANPPATPASNPVSTVSPVSTMGEAPSARRSLASLASLLSSGTLSSRLARCVR